MSGEPSYFEKLKFEHELLNSRITWLLTSQTILFAAYGLADKQLAGKYESFIKVIPIIGLVLSIAILIGIVAAIFAKTFTWLKNREEHPQFGVKTWITIMGFVPDISLPFLFMYGWIQLGASLCA